MLFVFQSAKLVFTSQSVVFKPEILSNPAFTSRTELLLGKEAVEKLSKANILAVGAGGVGGYAIEMLARAGVGHMTIVDGDTVDTSNLNRQIIATIPVIGQPKASTIALRLKEINPLIEIQVIDNFLYESDVEPLLKEGHFSFIADAIDSVGTKCKLIEKAFEFGIPIVSSMGAGARLDIGRIHIEKLCRTHHDGLGKAVRKRLSHTDIPQKLDVVFSDEPARPEATVESEVPGRKMTVGTVSWIPAAFGCRMAQYIICKIIG